ncbi:MAG: TonB-dependent receptor, partial [Paucibacter sp.]|nr:TonB-dependent receptor [Roseateles sp.]
MSDAVQAQVASSAALGTVVVTATRSPMQAAELTSDVLVITREDILSQTGIGDIADLLRNSGAVEFARTGSPGQPTSIFIRGANSEHTLVMIDGVRLDSQSISGGALWESIPLNQIDHVEVVKGPSSALYGSEAIGGVIQ